MTGDESAISGSGNRLDSLRTDGGETDARSTDGIDHSVVKSVEVVPSQTEMFDGKWDVVIRLDHETVHITVGASDSDVAAAWDAAVEAGRLIPEDSNDDE